MAASIVRTTEGARAGLQVAGSFDRECAWALRERLEDELEASEILLDFRQVTDFSDMAVALLANGLARQRAQVVVRGLGARQLRILRYCEAPVVSADGDAPPVGSADEAPRAEWSAAGEQHP